MPKATDAAVPVRDRMLFRHNDPCVTLDEGGTPRADGLAARLAGLELDAGTLELVMAALTADVCDQIDGADA